MAVSPMMTHKRSIPNCLLLIRMAGEHLDQSQRVYYMDVDCLNLNMHSLDHVEIKA